MFKIVDKVYYDFSCTLWKKPYLNNLFFEWSILWHCFVLSVPPTPLPHPCCKINGIFFFFDEVSFSPTVTVGLHWLVIIQNALIIFLSQINNLLINLMWSFYKFTSLSSVDSYHIFVVVAHHASSSTFHATGRFTSRLVLWKKHKPSESVRRYLWTDVWEFRFRRKN